MPVAMMLLSLAGRQACVAGRRGGVWKTAATSTASLPRGQQRNGPSSCATPASQARAIESAAIRPPAPPPMPLAEGTQSGGTRRAARQSDLIANRRRPHHAATGWTGNGASVPSSRARATPGACEGSLSGGGQRRPPTHCRCWGTCVGRASATHLCAWPLPWRPLRVVPLPRRRGTWVAAAPPPPVKHDPVPSPSPSPVVSCCVSPLPSSFFPAVTETSTVTGTPYTSVLSRTGRCVGRRGRVCAPPG